jgi:hypothetical protein
MMMMMMMMMMVTMMTMMTMMMTMMTMLASPARTPNRDDPYGAPLLRGTSPGGSEPQGGANFTPFSIGANLTPFFTASACSHKGEEEQETT